MHLKQQFARRTSAVFKLGKAGDQTEVRKLALGVLNALLISSSLTSVNCCHPSIPNSMVWWYLVSSQCFGVVLWYVDILCSTCSQKNLGK